MKRLHPTRLTAARAAGLAAFLLLGACAPSNDGPEAAGTVDGPICARPKVVQFVMRELRRQEPYIEIVPETIGERPGRVPTELACAMTIVRRDYDYPRYWTQTWIGYQDYTVKKLERGYEVTLERVRQE